MSGTAATVSRTAAGIGGSVPRLDGVPKVKGTFAYGSDLWLEGMLWGATVRGQHPRARVRSVDVSAAAGMPGVRAVLTASDLTGKRTLGLEYADQPVLAGAEVRYVGEPVAIVAADHPESARRAAAAVRVSYEELPPVTDMEQALRPDAPQVHPLGNVLRHVRVVHGDPDADADVWVEGYYETGMQDQAPLGPEAGLAVPAGDGSIDLYVSTQWLHVDRAQIAPCLNLPQEQVRLHLAGVGGAFGAREDVHMQIHACLLALRTGLPVKMSYGREESFHGHVHRHPARIWMRTGARRDGTLVAMRARLLVDGGAYASSSSAVISNAATIAAGPYEMPNAHIEGTAVFTNNPPCGAMRGFGAVQVCFAHEAQMDKLAAALGMDPVSIRLRNALARGSVLPTGQVITGSAPVREVIERCAALPLPPEVPAAGRDPVWLPGGTGNVSRGERIRRGTGFAIGYKNIAYSEGFDDSAAARVRVSREAGGPVALIHTAAAEVGQGLHTVLTQIVRTELGVDQVLVLPPDTRVGSAGSTSASRQTVMSGGAVVAACASIRAELLRRVAARATARGAGPAAVTGAGPLALADGLVLFGDMPVGPISDFLDEPIEATEIYRHRPTTAMDENGQGEPHAMFAFGAQRAVVEVDEELGLVRVVQLAVVQDVGRALNPRGVEGQIEGGAAQGLGLALLEELRVEGGRIRNASFTDYLLPTILDMPPVLSAWVEDPEPDSPYGAKGVGEGATIVATAAIVAALRDATGRALNRAPVTPDDLIGLAPPRTGGAPPPAPRVPGPRPLYEYT